ncbi:MAG TPA: hypothetical protein VFQ72_02180 [Candidatus Paceibacterota bacterium]|nr:hypothetical protein [Candidatus Paceibacterota bacterium]
MAKFSWQTPEYIHFEKSNDWYWTVGIITAALVVTAIILGDILFGVVLAIAAFTLAVFASRPPNVVSVEVTDRGVVIGKTLFPYAELESFSVDEEHHHGPRLVLRSKKPIVPLITVPIMHDGLDDLREHLERHLRSEKFPQNFMHTVFERLGF